MSDELGPASAARSRPMSNNIERAAGAVTASDRSKNLGHRSLTVWFTGLSGSGKSTLAFALEAILIKRGIAAYVLDGDNIRFGLNDDLGFSPEDRTENIRRIGHVCRLFQDAGIVVLSAFVSPYVADRDMVRSLHDEGSFVEVFVDTPIDVCESRDVKGLYEKARAGEIGQFTGVSAPYEPPAHPEIRVDTSRSVEECVDKIVTLLGL